jgi:two-component system chemotaxis sensor kinase CheA
MDRTKYQKIFDQESERYLSELDGLLMRVEEDLLNRDLWGEIHGKIHSIKGMARALSMDRIARLSHSMESWCKEFQQGATKATPHALQVLVDGAELLRVLVARKGEAESYENERWYSSLTSNLAKSPEQATARDQPQLSSRSPTFSETQKIDHVRIRYSLIEELLGLSQEILFSEKTRPPLSLEQNSAGLKNWIDHYRSMLKTLHFGLTQLRLMSVGEFADLFMRPIRNLAKEHNREARLQVIGGELQADITLLERLREPFIHLFRNCIAHGIEPPDERIRAGKDAVGRILLETGKDRDNLIIKISDDGRGINRSAIAKYLKDKRSMTDEQIARMPQEEFLNTILSTGFSSVSETTDMAGRGVGMDVVLKTIEYLGGSMTICSEPTKGTEFTMKLPVYLSVICAITFKMGEYTLSIPTSNVESIDSREHILPEDSTSFYDLRSLLGINNNGGKAFYILKLKHHGEKSSPPGKGGDLEVVVDSIIGNKPLMVMPVGELLAKARLFAGVGIMENGDISILLDVESLPAVQILPGRRNERQK